MLTERDRSVLAENQRVIAERKRDLELMLSGQFRETVMIHAESEPKHGDFNPTYDAAGLYARVCGDTALCSAEFAMFCVEYADIYRKRISLKALLQNDENEPPAEPGRTSYLKNSFTDKAYRVFSSKIRGLTAAYYQSYAAACEEVYYGRSAYVILPVYNSSDGKLISFKRMLTKYDLKISAACMIDMDEDSTVQYVLARKGLVFDSPEFFDAAVVLPDGVSPGAFLTACEVFGVSALLIHSVPLEYSSDSYGRHELSIQFYVKDANFSAFVLFLEASHIRYSIEGLYRVYGE